MNSSVIVAILVPIVLVLIILGLAIKEKKE